MPKISRISEEELITADLLTTFYESIICCFLDMYGKICKLAKGNDRQSSFDSNVDFCLRQENFSWEDHGY